MIKKNQADNIIAKYSQQYDKKNSKQNDKKEPSEQYHSKVQATK